MNTSSRAEQIIQIMINKAAIRRARRRNANNAVTSLLAMNRLLKETYPEYNMKRPSFFRKVLNFFHWS